MKVNKIRMRETVISYAFLAPVLLFFIVFVLAPMVMGFVTSFFNYSMTSFSFVGLDNYSRMFKDPVFIKSLINTVIIVIGSVPIVVLFSLFVASQTYSQNAIARSFSVRLLPAGGNWECSCNGCMEMDLRPTVRDFEFRPEVGSCHQSEYFLAG